ncbi:MAG: T9SS type A sorting domain-containing protein [Ignavibacteriaceae bacterium]|nr:T9SS type A sorting domain-containing protein [Ignavibacteriaceae bacterium]
MAFIFLSFVTVVITANISDTNLIGCTELNGDPPGCVCHTFERDTSVIAWVEGPDTLRIGETGYYTMYLTGGPAEAGGYNVAGRFGQMELVDTFSYQNPLALNELTQAFSLPFPTLMDTIYWNFGYTASDSSAEWDTIYSCAISLVWDSIPDPLDRWNFGPKFPVKILDPITNASVENESLNSYKLFQNYPNPFNPTTTIKYEIPELSFITIKIYDMLGNKVATLVNEDKLAGSYEVNLNSEGLTSGVYFYQFEAGKFIESKKMLLLK